MTILTCPNKQKQYDEMVSEISEISNEINQEAKQGKAKHWKVKMKFTMIQDLIEEIQALLEDDRIQNSPIL